MTNIEYNHLCKQLLQWQLTSLKFHLEAVVVDEKDLEFLRQRKTDLESTLKYLDELEQQYYTELVKEAGRIKKD